MAKPKINPFTGEQIPLPVLQLALKGKWFHQVAKGEKIHEYRLYNDYWRKRLENKQFCRVVITWGYPKKGDLDRRLEFPWRGCTIQTIISDEWNSEPKKVFSIFLLAEESQC